MNEVITTTGYEAISSALNSFFNKRIKNNKNKVQLEASLVNVMYLAEDNQTDLTEKFNFSSLENQLTDRFKKKVIIIPFDEKELKEKKKLTLSKYNLGLIAPIKISRHSIELLPEKDFFKLLAG